MAGTSMLLAAQLTQWRRSRSQHEDSKRQLNSSARENQNWPLLDRFMAMSPCGAHAIDLALYLLGFPQVSDVSGVTRSIFVERSDYTYLDMHGNTGEGLFDVDDSASAFLRCVDGSM